jgi:hypothetical protein
MKQKVYKLDLPPRQKEISICCAREEIAGKNASWGGGKRCQVLKYLINKIWS